jgi:hypothetical protein
MGGVRKNTMGQLAIIGFSALAGAALLGLVAANDTLLGIFMGALVGGACAIGALAFPHDLDYRERRVWPPKVPYRS